ncbi:ABC transporter permease subunit [Arthrobacter sp. CAU 1506]|uniref:ABC transporter permease n=1 Tax=Arthrobacter sp. CAU 1506 TaxID=2560052 RepID=UPI0010ABED2C|nr:ABC transporter permease subunit [Arthrobacter sp. CAU 1506]TJY66273.1 ABC transporter permease subunit [Arthrobacter sp. CAU 1506]
MLKLSRPPRLVFGIVSVVFFLAAWEVIAWSGLLGSSVPAMFTTLSHTFEFLGQANSWAVIGETVAMALSGLLLAIVAGVALGILIGLSATVRHGSKVIVEFLKPVPPIVILPVVVLVLGPTMGMGVFLVFIGCVIPILVQTAAGVVDTDPVALDSARSFGIGKLETTLKVVLPSAMAFIGSSIRITAPIALVVAVVAGLFGGGPGLGRLLMRAASSGQQTEVFSIVLVAGMLGLLFQSISVVAERRVLHWHPSQRVEETR